tara:strand:+ start:353 stop:790 length:438 start_codon:yes stop_codon:yes gene_type:complete
MGGSKGSKPIAPPKAPPPPAEDVTAEVIAPAMRQEAARRARMGAYVTRGQRIGTGGQLLGAAPIQLANVQAATDIGRATPVAPEKKLEDFGTIPTKRSYGGSRSGIKMAAALVKRQSAYDKYLKQRQKNIDARNKRINPEGGMVI